MTSIFGLKEERTEETEEEKAYQGHQLLENVDYRIIDKLYREEAVCSCEIDAGRTILKNEYITIKNGSQSVLARLNGITHNIERIESKTGYGIAPRNAEQTMALDMLLNPDIPLVTLTGVAGTGKTLLALAAALENRRLYWQIHLSRPVIPLERQSIGFLPGDINDKIGPFMMPLYDNLNIIRRQFHPNSKEAKKLKDIEENEKLVIEPLAFIRGRSMQKAFIIVDEAQNLDAHEVKTIITRAGEGTKIVFTGDTEQVDDRRLEDGRNGLSKLVDRFKGQKLYAHIELIKGERSELAALAAKLL
jgi:PhoH-like ATPase